MSCFSVHKACGILVHQSVIEPLPPALEGKVLTTRWTARELPKPHFLLQDPNNSK